MINTELSTGTFLGNLTCMLPKEQMEECLPKSITNFSDNSSNSNHHIQIQRTKFYVLCIILCIQIQRTKIERFHLYKVPKVVRHMQTEIRTLVTRGFGRRNGELVFSGDRVSDGEDEKFCRWMVVMVAKPCEVYLEIMKTVNFILFYVMLFYHNKKKMSTVGMRDIFLQCWVLLSSLQSTPKAICLSYREPAGSPQPMTV